MKRSRIGKRRRTRTSRKRTRYTAQAIRDARMQLGSNYAILNQRTAGVLGVELKWKDLGLAGSALTAPTDASGGEHDPATVECLNGMIEGSGENERIGRSITMKKISIRGTVNVPIQANQTAADALPPVFIALVLDKQANGATLNSEDVFTNAAGSAATAASPFRNLEYNQRFRVLKTRTIELAQQTMNTTYDDTNVEQSGFTVPWDMYCSLGDIQTNFTDANGTIASILDNALHLIAYTVSVTAAPTINYNSRLRYVG